MQDQFANPDNWRAHYETTAPEIVRRQTSGEITHFISAMGTTGTIMGTSRFLEGEGPLHPDHRLPAHRGREHPGIRRWPEASLPKIYEPARVDRIIDIAQTDAEATTRDLARKEGVFGGVSPAGAVWAARKLRASSPPRTATRRSCASSATAGDRYLSSPLFRPGKLHEGHPRACRSCGLEATATAQAESSSSMARRTSAVRTAACARWSSSSPPSRAAARWTWYILVNKQKEPLEGLPHRDRGHAKGRGPLRHSRRCTSSSSRGAVDTNKLTRAVSSRWRSTARQRDAADEVAITWK